jgi:pyruvate carboxylase
VLTSLGRYGFLSENASFARKVEQAGLAFVGPTPEAIDGLGDKTKARTLGKHPIDLPDFPVNRPNSSAVKVGVPVVPGTPGPVDTYQDGDSFIKEYGFPGSPNAIRPVKRH